MPHLPMDENNKRLLKTSGQPVSDTVIPRLPTNENRLTVESQKRPSKTLLEDIWSANILTVIPYSLTVKSYTTTDKSKQAKKTS